MRAMKNSCRGMTLIELMTALSVLGILLAMATPSFRSFTANSRTTATTNDLVTALNVARSEALRRSTVVIVCPSNDQANCINSNDWSTGWIVFADRNGSGTVNTDELVQAWQGSGGMSVAADANRVAYNVMGMREPMTGTVQITVTAPGCKGNNRGRTQILPAGTIQSTKVACPT